MRLKLRIPRLTMRRILLFVAVALSGLQFYDPNAQSFVPPLCMLAALALLPDLIRAFKVVLDFKPTLLLLLLALTYLVSLTWSVDLQLGTRTIVYVLMFLTIFAAGWAEARRDPAFVLGLLFWTLVFALGQIAVILLFRLHPYLKLSFFRSYLAGLFVNPDALAALFTTAGADNVLDPTKSGGIFINANVAGAYAGFMTATAFGLAWAYRRPRWYFGAIIFLLGAYATGSKAAILLCGALGLAMVAVTALRARRRAARFALIDLTLLPLALLIGYFLNAFKVGNGSESFGNQAAATLRLRTLIWGYASEIFPQTPLLGQGFGGWQLGFTSYAAGAGIPPNFPPHNLLIYMWSQGGMAALLCGIGFSLCILWFAARNLTSRRREVFGLSFGLTAGLLWMIIQAMGENYSLVGDEHLEPVLALLCGFILARFAAAKASERVPAAAAPALAVPI